MPPLLLRFVATARRLLTAGWKRIQGSRLESSAAARALAEQLFNLIGETTVVGDTDMYFGDGIVVRQSRQTF